MKKLAFLSLCFLSLALFSQTKISGFIPEEHLDSKNSQIDLIEVNEDSTSVFASTTIDPKGYFQFQELMPELPRFYYVKLRDQEVQSRKMFLQNDDDVFFEKTAPPLTNSFNKSLSDAEWTKLKRFRNRINGKKTFLDDIRTYSKDSLQILAVKLISIKELDQKQLLAKDIALNRSYYAALLEELKESEINPNEYLFLELKLTELKMYSAQESYAMSKGLNIGLFLLLIGLSFYAFIYKRNKTQVAVLSKQEQAIKELILAQKSNKEIASELFISVSTVKTHITSIYQKLQVMNRGELILKFKK
jgi:DNA-binding CsgD family transcriptional regulator